MFRDVVADRGLMTWRELMLAVAAGVASAAIGQLMGRTVHTIWPIPASGSIAVALPRAVILLIVLLRVRHFGALTAAGVAELSAKLAICSGALMPWSVVVPLLANFAGDVLWAGLRQIPGRRMRLMLTGCGLCTARAMIALLFWGLAGMPLAKPLPEHLLAMLSCIVVVNAVLGAIAGLLVSGLMKPAQPGDKE